MPSRARAWCTAPTAAPGLRRTSQTPSTSCTTARRATGSRSWFPSSTMSKAVEPFGRLPNRLAGDLARGDLTLYGLAIIAWLELSMNYRQPVPSWTGTIQRMLDEMHWPHQKRHLSRELAKLREAGYVEGGPKPRSRAPFTLTLLRGAV